MLRPSSLGAALLLACLTIGIDAIVHPCHVRAEARSGVVIPQQQALAHGMRRSWVTRVGLDRARDRVRSVLIEPQMIFVLSERGTLYAVDAATGNTVWTTPTGNRNYPSLGPGASDTHVAVVNGSTLYVFRRSDGRPLWEEELTGVPTVGPVIDADWVYVPMFNGLIVAYPLEVSVETRDERLLGRVPVMYSASGRAESPLLITPHSIAWGTSSGFIYTAPLGSMKARLQYLARSAIRAPLAYREPAILAASLVGYLDAIDEITGQTLWTFVAGGTSSQAPVVIGDAVYLVQDRGGMFRLSADTGLEYWRAPRVTQFLAASTRRVYAADALGRVLVLNRDSGRLVDVLPTQRLTWKLTNTVTDRLYLGTRDGVLQSLHELALTEPIMHGAPAVAEEAQQPAAEAGEGEMPPQDDQPQEGDPFAEP